MVCCRTRIRKQVVVTLLTASGGQPYHWQQLAKLLYNWHAPICESQKPFWLKCICRISVMPVAKHQCFEDLDTSLPLPTS